MLRTNTSGARRSCCAAPRVWHERDHAGDRQVQNLRLAHPITIPSSTFMPRTGWYAAGVQSGLDLRFALGSDGLARGPNVWQE
jgi:hypothetical protein